MAEAACPCKRLHKPRGVHQQLIPGACARVDISPADAVDATSPSSNPIRRCRFALLRCQLDGLARALPSSSCRCAKQFGPAECPDTLESPPAPWLKQACWLGGPEEVMTLPAVSEASSEAPGGCVMTEQSAGGPGPGRGPAGGVGVAPAAAARRRSQTTWATVLHGWHHLKRWCCGMWLMGCAHGICRAIGALWDG